MKQTQVRAEKIRELKDKCEVCGNDDKDVLVFHHRDPAAKEFGITSALPLEMVLSEIEKCAIYCFNCHAKHHREHPVRTRKRKKVHKKDHMRPPSKELGSLNSLSEAKLLKIIEKCQNIISGRKRSGACMLL